MKKIASFLIDDTEYTDSTKRLWSLVFLSVACVLSFQEYAGVTWFAFSTEFDIKPDIISGVLSLILVVPLYARGILKWRASIYGKLSFILILSVFASTTQIALSDDNDIVKYLLVTAIAVSWLGMRGVAGFGWILTFTAAFYNAISVSDAMGSWGYIFIISAFLGLLFHSNLSPDKLVADILDDYNLRGGKIGTTVKDDIAASRKLGE